MNKSHSKLTGSAIQACERVHRWPTPASKDWTIRFLNSAYRDENIMAVIAVGSAVRPSVSSVDLDLVVICHEPKRLRTKSPIEVDLRTYACGQVDELIQGGNDLLGWAVKFGRLLFQREGFWDIVLKSWLDRLPLPSTDVAVQRANAAFRRLSAVFELGDTDAAHELALSYLTHHARAELLRNRVYPASRPELPGQLRSIGCLPLAEWLDHLLNSIDADTEQIARLIETRPPTCHSTQSTRGANGVQTM